MVQTLDFSASAGVLEDLAHQRLVCGRHPHLTAREFARSNPLLVADALEPIDDVAVGRKDRAHRHAKAHEARARKKRLFDMHLTSGARERARRTPQPAARARVGPMQRLPAAAPLEAKGAEDALKGGIDRCHRHVLGPDQHGGVVKSIEQA